MMVTPAARAASTSATVFASIPVLSITGATAVCNTPPSETNSFWNSISTIAVVAGSSCSASDITSPGGGGSHDLHASTPAAPRQCGRPPTAEPFPRLARAYLDSEHPSTRGGPVTPDLRWQPSTPPPSPEPWASGGPAIPGWLEERLFDQRIVMIRGPLTGQVASGIAAALLTLDAAGPEPVQLHVASSGGDLNAAHAVIDVMDAMAAPVHAVVTSEAGGAVLAVLAAAERPRADRDAPVKPAEPPAPRGTGTPHEGAPAARQHP